MSEPNTILIIDDDPDFVAAISHLLETCGHRVRSAPDERKGTEGFFTLERIRRTPALKHVRVIVVSSIYTEYPSFRVNPDAGWLPADLFLAKPADPQRLINEVTRLLATPPIEGAPQARPAGAERGEGAPRATAHRGPHRAFLARWGVKGVRGTKSPGLSRSVAS